MKSMLLKTSVLLIAPALFAYGSSDEDMGRSTSPIAIGVEVQGHAINVGWHTKTTVSKTLSLAKATAAITNASAYVYAESNDKVPNYTFGGRITAKTNFSDDFGLMVAVGIENGMGDAKSLRPLNTGTTSTAAGDVLTAEWDAQDTTGVSTIKNSMVVSPAAFVSYGSIGLGVQYDMREFETSGHDTGLDTLLNKTLKDNQVLFGFRGEQCYDMDDMKLVFSVEYMTNLGAKADSDMETHFANLTKYGLGLTLPSNSGTPISSGVTAGSALGYANPLGDRGVVGSTYTNITKGSIGIGVQFAEF